MKRRRGTPQMSSGYVFADLATTLGVLNLSSAIAGHIALRIGRDQRTWLERAIARGRADLRAGSSAAGGDAPAGPFSARESLGPGSIRH
jgi:hypothetical protein